MMEAAPAKKEFHFPGGGIWHNGTIWASTIEEAEKLWHSTKRLINPSTNEVAQSTPAEAEEPEETKVQ